jgi:hypothetical protein
VEEQSAGLLSRQDRSAPSLGCPHSLHVCGLRVNSRTHTHIESDIGVDSVHVQPQIMPCPYTHTHTHTHTVYIYTYTYIHTYICNILDEYIHKIHTCFVLYHEGVVVVEGLPLFGVDHFGQRQNVRLYASKCMLEFMHVSYVYVCIIHAHTHVDVYEIYTARNKRPYSLPLLLLTWRRPGRRREGAPAPVSCAAVTAAAAVLEL